MADGANISKVVLAYSGGLDSSAILHWLQDRYGCEVVCFMADLGQPDEIDAARNKAEKLGAVGVYIEDLRERFVGDFVFPMLRANTVYEDNYLLGTAIARPLIAQRLVEIAREIGAEAIAHGATTKGNDQIRFELGVAALAPDLKVISPWREWEYSSRQDILEYCAQHKIEVDFAGEESPPWSMDANMLHISYEGGVLEDPDVSPPEGMWRWTHAPEKAKLKPRDIEITFERGDAVALDGKKQSPAKLLALLNDLGAQYGIGRADIVENRATGMKSRGCYETPGGTILLEAHKAIESITLDLEVSQLKRSFMPRYADLIYNGYWFSPERLMLQAAIDSSQEWVNGVVRLTLYPGYVMLKGRRSEHSLYDEETVSFENMGDEDWDARDGHAYTRIKAARFRRGGARTVDKPKKED